ncbi:MAG: STAS domain-containing protein [Candidatus Latescibacterota bacterium]
MSDEFWIRESETEKPTAILKIGGRLGAQPAKKMRIHCDMLRDRGFRFLIVDMSEVSFIASSGVGALIVLTGEFSVKGGSVRFVSLSPAVRRVIRLLNLERFITIDASEEEALAKING